MNHDKKLRKIISEKAKERWKNGRYSNPKVGFQKGHTINVGRIFTNEQIQNMKNAQKGKVISKETREKIRITKTGKKYPNCWKGKFIKCPVCGKEKYKYPRDIKRVKSNYCSKECAYKDFKGKHHSINSEFKKENIQGKNHPNWKGGITPINNKIRGSEIGRIWCMAVAKKYDYTCQKCLINCKWHEAIHHMRNFAEEIRLRFDVNNGIVFCRSCHKEFHRIYGRRNNNYKQVKEFIYG
jgi:hypothetical protein